MQTGRRTGQRIWVITDTHFGHNKLVKDGLRNENFENSILRNCTRDIEAKDVVIHLGDVSFYNDMKWNTEFLVCCASYRNILIRGNHDRKTLQWYYERGWCAVMDQMVLEIYGERILFSHCPVYKEINPDFSINIHGHLHDGSHREMDQLPYHECVSIEGTLAPILLKTLVERNQRKQSKRRK